MLSWQQLSQLASNLAKLGARRLAILAASGALVLAVVGFSAYYLGRPAMQPIYTGLNSQDVTRITAALAEAGIPFDVNEQRSAVLVAFGHAPATRARSDGDAEGVDATGQAGCAGGVARRAARVLLGGGARDVAVDGRTARGGAAP